MLDVSKLNCAKRALEIANARPRYGRLSHVRGPVLKACFAGIGVGEICRVSRDIGGDLLAEVIGIDGTFVSLFPFGDPKGVTADAVVSSTNEQLTIPFGTALLGRLINPFGIPIDNGVSLPDDLQRRPINSGAPPAMVRPIIDTPLATGVRAIDGVVTLGRGQRLGVFGSPGTGKSMLLSSISRNTDADIIVIGLVGERGREVREFFERELPAEVRDRVCAVVATSDRPAAERALCAQTATAVAEGFRDEGNSVLLLIDSLSRTARAMREIGLAAGEPPARRGYPASVYPMLPALIERAGRSEVGDITALYTVLVEGDAQSDPIAEEVKSLTDGHLILSQSLAASGHFPAISVLDSLSRSMPAVVSERHREAARGLRARLAKYDEIELLLQVGEYQNGTDPEADLAVASKPRIDAFLQQSVQEKVDFESVVAAMEKTFR